MTQVILPSTVVITPPPGVTPVSLYVDAIAGITSEALATMTIQKGDAASTTGSTYAPTAGKTFRLMSAAFMGSSSSTALVAPKARVRSLASGTVTATGPVRLNAYLSIPVATAANGTGLLPIFLAGGSAGLLDVPAAGSLGITHVAGATTYLLSVHLQGYEF